MAINSITMRTILHLQNSFVNTPLDYMVLQLQNSNMKDKKTPRPAGRPRVMHGEQVQVTLRLTAVQREKLTQLGGAAWVRGQIERAQL